MAILTFRSKLCRSLNVSPKDRLSLVAEQRQRSFFESVSDSGREVRIKLKRGTTLNDGDILMSAPDETGTIQYFSVTAKPEPVVTVTADSPLALLKAAYHLGNRHVPLEVADGYLRFSPDPVLQSMLEKMPVTLTEAIAPFFPEAGAYHQPNE